MTQKVSVRFLRSVGPYNSGERAGFTASELSRLNPDSFEVIQPEGEAGEPSPGDDVTPSKGPRHSSASPSSSVAAPAEPEADRAMQSPRKRKTRRGS